MSVFLSRQRGPLYTDSKLGPRVVLHEAYSGDEKIQLIKVDTTSLAEFDKRKDLYQEKFNELQKHYRRHSL